MVQNCFETVSNLLICFSNPSTLPLSLPPPPHLPQALRILGSNIQFMCIYDEPE